MKKLFLGILVVALSISHNSIEARTTQTKKKITFSAPTDGKKIPQRISSSLSRGCQRKIPKVTLLTPPEYIGLTTSPQTEVFIYFEEKPEIPVYLTLSKFNESQAIIEKQLVIEQKGVTKVQLPIELEIGYVYQWSLTLICQTHPKRIDENEEVSGLIEKVTLPASVSQKINQASRWEKANLYASLGIWHESLKFSQNSSQFSDLLQQVGIIIEK